MPLQLTIVTPEGVRFEGPVERVLVPGAEGDFEVLPGHERFLSPVKIGELDLQAPGGKSAFAAVTEGFAEVTADKVVLMVDAAEFAEDIDTARADRAKANAEREIEQAKINNAEEASYRLAELALQRAAIRIQVAGKSH